MSKLDTVKKVMLYQKDKSGFVKEPTISEMADLVVLVLSQVKVIEDAIKAGRLDGKTPIKDVEYMSRESAIKMLTQAVNEALNNEEDKFIGRVEGKFNSKVYQSEKTRDEAVNGAIERINQKLSEVKDGVVTEAEIRRAANIALGMIELPDFASLIKENVDGETVRDALALLTGDKRYQVQIADVDGLADALAQVSQIRANGGGTIGKQQVYNFIRQAIADGIITSGAGTGDVVGPASAVDSNFAGFDTTTGKLLKDSGSKASDFAPALGADDNYVTDAEKVKLSNLSGTNTGDQDLSALAPKASPTFTGTVTLPTGLTGVLRADSGVVSTDSDVTDLVTKSVASDINTGTSTTNVVTPDALAGSNLGIRYAQVTLNGSTALTTSEKAYFRIPAALNGMNLVSVSATVGTGAAGSSSSGTPTFTVKNVTDNQQMLSTSLTVDVSEYTSATAATAAVINTTYDDVATDDLIEVAVTTSGTGVTYATVTLGFQLP